jgi:hypothetical protein
MERGLQLREAFGVRRQSWQSAASTALSKRDTRSSALSFWLIQKRCRRFALPPHSKRFARIVERPLPEQLREPRIFIASSPARLIQS